jgi:hypothetical protein
MNSLQKMSQGGLPETELFLFGLTINNEEILQKTFLNKN